MDNSLKGFILAASTLITCMVLSVGFYFTREAKVVSAMSTDKLNQFSTELTENDLTMYDGLEVTGSDVVNLIKKQLGKYPVVKTAPIYIFVKTSIMENTYKNNTAIEKVKNFTNSEYINPLSKFTGAIVRDGNDVIIGVRFIQI